MGKYDSSYRSKNDEEVKLERVNRILRHPLFEEHLRSCEAFEEDRRFCLHDIGHFMDVARIAYILCLEKKYDISKETVYAAALLHDIGRDVQYSEGTPHGKAGARIASKILEDCGFSGSEIESIAAAIAFHSGREKDVSEADALSGVIFDADKLSRKCFACKASEECKWSPEKKNNFIGW
ncbi:MAG: HD domain-containing protein [Lachnospiraceae bacterium]|jgi:uncharacterized protein